MAGTQSAERLIRAAHAARELCDVLWESLHEELHNPEPERIRRLSKRLSDVSATVGMLAQETADGSLRRNTAPVEERRERRTPPDPVPHPPVPGLHETPMDWPPGGERSGPQERPSPDLRLAPHPPSTRLVDEHESARTGEPYLDDRPSGVVIPAGIEAHDVRREQGTSAWVSSVGRMLQRYAADRLPFAVLLIEIVDVARLERSETPHDLHGIVRQVENALGRGMRSTDELSRETLGRYWLAAPDTDTSGARMLAERLAHLVHTTTSHRNVPLAVAIGIAMCPHDGTDAPALAARADLGVYSARATGRSVAHSDLPQG